jgi:hypothetical protein
MRYLFALIVLSALAAGGCGPADTAADTAQRAEIARILDAARPAAASLKAGDITWYEPDDLYEYIDGDAGRFTDAGFVWLAHQEYKAAGGGEGYIEVDLYDLAAPLGALGIFGDSRSEQAKYVPVGNEAIDSGEMFEVRFGRYYLKLTPRKDAAALKPLVQPLAEAIVKAAPPGPLDAPLLAPLPAENIVPHTAAFTSKGFLGREYLKQVREAAYEVQGKRVRLFLMDAGSPEKAKAALAEWKESLPPQPIGAQPDPLDPLSRVPRLPPGTISYSEEYVGAITAQAHGKWVAGTIGDPAAGKALLASLTGRLE